MPCVLVLASVQGFEPYPSKANGDSIGPGSAGTVVRVVRRDDTVAAQRHRVTRYLSKFHKYRDISGCPLVIHLVLYILHPLIPHTTQANAQNNTNIQLLLGDSEPCATRKGPSWPHAFSKSISSERIEAASWNRGAILHK
jgi:hypothetical protein